ncbi:hypothetical protein [Comamonas fluminis]|uniref:hypothetical protein n=1 Tax=Comamonas fluminis TaxID=2796366 RepID=UPI001C447271|nr:hypothetical protein [Comamonas fluminis]
MSTHPATDLLAKKLIDQQSNAASYFAGYERLAITEIFRSLDMCAYAFRMAPNREYLLQHDQVRHWMLAGAASALKPLLKSVAKVDGPMPWGPSSAQWTGIVEGYLPRCGQLNWLLRLASLEKYGLSQTTLSASKIRIEVASDELESADRESLNWLGSQKLDATGVQRELDLAKGQLKRIRRRLDKKSGLDMGGWFIRYSGDDKLFERSRQRVHNLEPIWHETEALPDEVTIGGQTFREWKNACCLASAAVLHHLEFSTRLKAKHASVDLRNLLTMFIRRDDLERVWLERGLEPRLIGAVSQAMTLNYQSVEEVLQHHDTPLPFYVDLGRDFVLAPSLSALLNPFAGVTKHLRSCYRSDWDRAVDGRESVFRADIATIFKEPRYVVLPSGIALRRTDGSLLTDVDAVVQDRVSGTVALIQLKWHDIFGHSLRERESRKRNLLAANQWVERVATWVGERSSREIAKAFDMPTIECQQTNKPVILVIARYAARFSGTGVCDSRGAWLSWPELVRAATLNTHEVDILRHVATAFEGVNRNAWPGSDSWKAASLQLRFPGLDVEVAVSG